jgi:hypothetical protein
MEISEAYQRALLAQMAYADDLNSSKSVTVEVKTGTRRLMEFLLAPLMRGVSEGARER